MSGTFESWSDWGTNSQAGANEWWGATQPASSDSGVDYGSEVLDILKFGVGVLATRNQSEWEDKRRYESARNGIALQGQAAAVSAQSGGSMLSGSMPLLIIGGLAVVAVAFLLMND